jgi:hypothetical protein
MGAATPASATAAWCPEGKSCHAGNRDSEQRGDGGFGRTRGKHELEKRHRVAQSSLERPKRTVPSTDDQGNALCGQ